jgi:hypothetical protein
MRRHRNDKRADTVTSTETSMSDGAIRRAGAS